MILKNFIHKYFNMGNNNYQFRLQSLDALDEYKMKLEQQLNFLLGLPRTIQGIHESFSDSDKWNDIKHTEFFEEEINEIILALSLASDKVNKASDKLMKLKNIYASAGIS